MSHNLLVLQTILAFAFLVGNANRKMTPRDNPKMTPLPV